MLPANSREPGQTLYSAASDLVYTVFLCPTKRTLDLYGLPTFVVYVNQKNCILLHQMENLWI